MTCQEEESKNTASSGRDSIIGGYVTTNSAIDEDLTVHMSNEVQFNKAESENEMNESAVDQPIVNPGKITAILE